ncbi:MAG: nicotinate-nicotinamide nucleotide adenylyltransferase [Actinobacteria bacterium]|nr:nicotinate-nicotinamide nucleotide adenylyltransferase [Actinomycetota bacterium]
MTGLLGGTFNPPHYGHIALADAARRHFALDELAVLVAVRPGHKQVQLNADTRLKLARAAFPDYDVELDPHERTVDLLKEGRWSDPIFLIGADQFADFLTWKDPEGVIARARIGVATRPGYPRERLDEVLAQLSRPERIELFEIEPVPVSSREIRDRVARGEPIEGLVPSAVAALIDSLGLYRRDGYTSAVNGPDLKSH